MRPSNVNNFLLLYGNNDKEPYQPSSSWGLHDGFKLDGFLHPHKKEFIIDEFLHPNTWKSYGESNPASQDENLMS